MTSPFTTPPAPHALPQRTNVLAIIAVIAGFMVPVAGIATGFVALRQIARTGEEGRGLAITGIVAGFALSALTLAFFAVWLTMVLSIMTQIPFAP